MKKNKNDQIDGLYNDKGIVVETELERLSRLEMASTMMTQVMPDKTKYNRKEKHKGEYEK
jgi:hypothetical protein